MSLHGLARLPWDVAGRDCMPLLQKLSPDEAALLPRHASELWQALGGLLLDFDDPAQRGLLRDLVMASAAETAKTKPPVAVAAWTGLAAMQARAPGDLLTVRARRRNRLVFAAL